MRPYRPGIATHYQVLGVAPTASTDEIRTAYRSLARTHHPDAAGDPHAMAAINEAWRVLSDPGRRAMYDASLRGAAPSVARPMPDHDDRDDDLDLAQVRHGRLAVPIPWILVLGALVLIFVFTAYAARPGDDSPSVPTVDGVLREGSCVNLDTQARALEAPCEGPNLGTVEAIVPREGARCPLGTEGYLDAGGESIVCVRPG